MCVQSEKKDNEEMMCVPKSFVGLLAHLRMSGREHQEHAQ